MNLLKKGKVRTRSQLLKLAQAAFNRFVRERDAERGCISCPSPNVQHASHYYSQGHHSALRFNEVNVNGSCLKCNTFLHGNLIHYRNGLLKRYPQRDIDLLDSAARNKIKKWSISELEYIIKKYSYQIKA